MNEMKDVYDWVREHRMEPRVHPNGFLQIDLDSRRRMHIWGHPDIPRQIAYHPIHDHVFGFKSTVLVGRIVNVVYRPREVEGGRYSLYQCRPFENRGWGTELAPAGIDDRAHDKRYEMDVVRADMVHADESYSMKRFEFHESVPVQPSITVMEKDSPTLHENPNGPRPYVAVPERVEVDNEFKRDAYPRDMLMRIFMEVWEMRK